MYKIFMRSALNDLPVIENKDFVAEAAGRKPVADIDGCTVIYDLIELCIDFSLCNRIKGSRRLVKNQEWGVPIKRTCDSYFLCFATGNLNSIVPILTIEKRM